MKHKNKPSNGKPKPGSIGYRKYNITDPEVYAFARFKATPVQLRESVYGEGIRNELEYIRKLGMTGTQPPAGWFDAPGFWKLVDKLTDEFKADNVVLALNTLQKRMQGMKVVKTRIKKGAAGVVLEKETTVEESLPSVHAADVMLRAVGKIKTDAQEMGETLAAAMTRAAEIRRKK